MKGELTVIGGDRRFLSVKRFFTENGFSVNTVFLGENDNGQVNDTVILPVPVFRNGYLNAPLTDKKISENNLVDILPEKATVFGGMISESFIEKCVQKGIKVIDYYKDEALLKDNAQLTARAVPFILQKHGISAKSGNIFILGYGRTGKAIAGVLSSVGGNVTVVTGKNRADNYRFIHFDKLSDYLSDASLVINTVPSTVLSENELEKLNRNAVLIEIASAPFGIDFEAAEGLGIKVIKALALPGRYFPEEAGNAIAKVIIKEMN